MIQVACAKPSIIEETTLRDECAILYQFLAPLAACDLTVTSRGSQQLSLQWWSDKRPLISPKQVSEFVTKIKLGLVEHFSVKFMVSHRICCVAKAGYNIATLIGMHACMQLRISYNYS